MFTLSFARGTLVIGYAVAKSHFPIFVLKSGTRQVVNGKGEVCAGRSAMELDNWKYFFWLFATSRHSK